LSLPTPFEVLYGRRFRTPLCWYESGESALLGPNVVQETTKKVKMIQEKMKTSQSRQKSYHDKRRKDIEFQVGDHVFLRVNLVTGVGRALKCRNMNRNTQRRLDITISNQKWLDMYYSLSCLTFTKNKSDHFPLLLEFHVTPTTFASQFKF